MTVKRQGYFYKAQIKNYVMQFMAIFGGFEVMTGQRTNQGSQMISVPIRFGRPDKVVAALLSNNTQTSPIRVPMMSVSVDNLLLNQERMHGTGMERVSTYVPTGGLVPDDIKTIHQMMPVPWDITVSLHVYASNTDQHWQIIEQFMPMFDPLVQIEKSDALYDWTRMTMVELIDGPSFDENIYVQPGADRRFVISTTKFRIPAWIAVPVDIRRDFVEQVRVRIGMITQLDLTEQDIIDDLNSQGAVYEILASDAGLSI
jgi:hypothetical protein